MLSNCGRSRLYSPLILLIGGVALLVAAWRIPGSAAYDEGSRNALQFPSEGRATDCGAVALYIICKLEGMDCSLDDLRARVKTSIIGTDMYSLREGARSLDFTSDAVRCSFAELRSHVSKPGNYAILHSPLHSHFLAVVSADQSDAVRVADTVLGVKSLNDAELRRSYGWDGAALLLAAKAPIHGAP